MYLYTSHDEDDANADGKGFKMLNWWFYTSTDMVNWTDNGIVASLKDFSWAKQDNGAWAVQYIEQNGKFYLYCPMHGGGIGVLVSDSPLVRNLSIIILGTILILLHLLIRMVRRICFGEIPACIT